MAEINIIAVFFSCAAILVIGGVYAVKTSEKQTAEPRIYFILPINGNTSDIEFIVRQYIYKTVGQYPAAVIILYDMGADNDTVRIFEQLMDSVCDYKIVNNAEILR